MQEKLRTVLKIKLLAGLVFAILAALIFTLASPPKAQAAAAVCPTFLDGSRATSDLAVNPNKVRELDIVGWTCGQPDFLNQIKCFLNKIGLFSWARYLDIGDLFLQDSKMPAYLRYANELALSGDQDTLLGIKPPEPGAITGAIAKGLMPGYTQTNPGSAKKLDPIKELTESEDQLVKGTVTLNRAVRQKQFTTMPTYEEIDQPPPGYYELEVGSDIKNYQVEGRFGEVSPLYDRFGLLKQMLFPPAGKVAIPTVNCLDYDPTIIAIRLKTGFPEANPDRDTDWTTNVKVSEPDVILQCTLTTSLCPNGADAYTTNGQCLANCTKDHGTGSSCVADRDSIKRCCHFFDPPGSYCPKGTGYIGGGMCSTNCGSIGGKCVADRTGAKTCCSYFNTENICPPPPPDKSYELGGNLDVQSKVSYASKAWGRIGAPSTGPGKGGVFNVLLPPGSSFLTEQAEPLLDFDYAPYSPQIAPYRDGSTLYIAELGNVGGATDCIVNGLTAHPFAAVGGVCEVALEESFAPPTGKGSCEEFGWPTKSGSIWQGPYGTFSHKIIEAIDIGPDASRVQMGDPVCLPHNGTVVEIGYTEAYGKYVDVASKGYPQSWVSRFGHFSARYVTVGQSVTVGDVIGAVGDTGMGDVHTHYEFRFKALPMRPPYIPVTVPKGCVTIAGCGNITW